MKTSFDFVHASLSDLKILEQQLERIHGPDATETKLVKGFRRAKIERERRLQEEFNRMWADDEFEEPDSFGLFAIAVLGMFLFSVLCWATWKWWLFLYALCT